MKNLPTKHYVDAQGRYLGAFAGYQDEIPIYGEAQEVERPDGTIETIPPAVIGYELGAVHQPMPPDPAAIEVPNPPAHGEDIWNGAGWDPHSPAPIDLDAELDKSDPIIKALVELVPGGLDAVRTKVAALPGRSRLET